MEIKEIDYDSPEYQESLALRNRVMRIPLGLSIYEEDFSKESTAYILGAFESQRLIGVGVLSKTASGEIVSVDYLCVDTAIQSSGVGKQLLRALEDYGRRRGATQISLEARVSAQGFYERCGYQDFGEVYNLNHAPVPHVLMKKSL
ncbi:GNAT family N-acetyltransferase [Enterococcus asini]|uniref:GNAT family N-acetyltransferase n=1 Tax=Enterococcus asini TaxID=57732 RepID=UPI0026DC69FE|nr:GNAT family N-acetyltransferase [Enterococcus asini]MDT2744980.1 GNAT family N-acetyltransferase [Enterococcus asini]